jgi:hypothetical protein
LWCCQVKGRLRLSLTSCGRFHRGQS